MIGSRPKATPFIAHTSSTGLTRSRGNCRSISPNQAADLRIARGNTHALYLRFTFRNRVSGRFRRRAAGTRSDRPALSFHRTNEYYTQTREHRRADRDEPRAARGRRGGALPHARV